MSKTLADQTRDRAAAALRSAPAGCLPEIVKLLRTLASRSSEVSVSELADVIMRDAVILAKVIGAANTLGYNPGGSPVNSVDQAIHVIGYARIQALAMSLMLCEQTARSRTPEEQKEATLLALASGCVARTLVQKRTKLDPDRAYVFALLRNFGRLVMTTCMLDEYREARQLAGELTDDESFRRVFGLTPVQLGRQLLKASDLPDDLMAVLRELPPTVFEVLDAEPDQQLLAYADFSARLAELTLSGKLSPQEFDIEVRKLAVTYQNQLPGVVDEIPALIESASRQLDTFVRTFELKGLPAAGLSRLKQRRDETDPRRVRLGPPPAPESDSGDGVTLKPGASGSAKSEGVELGGGRHAATPKSATAPHPAAPVSPSSAANLTSVAPRPATAAVPGPKTAPTAVAGSPAALSVPTGPSAVPAPVATAGPAAPAGANAAPSAAARQPGTTANVSNGAETAAPAPASSAASDAEVPSYDWQVSIGRMTALLRTAGTTRDVLLGALLEAVREGFDAPECMLFSNQPGKQDFRITHGHGRLFEPLQMPARITARDRTVFGVCLSRSENIIVHHANDPKILPYMPGWLGVPPALGAFALLPLSDGKKSHGLLLAGWPEPRPIRISPEQVRHLRTLLTFVCQAGARLAA